LRAREQVGLLRAPDHGRAQVLVEAGLELHVGLFEIFLRAPQLQVEAAQRRAAVAGDEATGVQPRGLVAQALHQRQPHQRLHAGQVDAPFRAAVLVFEGVVAVGDAAGQAGAGRGGGGKFGGAGHGVWLGVRCGGTAGLGATGTSPVSEVGVNCNSGHGAASGFARLRAWVYNSRNGGDTGAGRYAGGADVTRSTGKYAARPPGLGPTAQPRPGVAGAAGVAGRLRTRGRVRPDLRNRRRDARSRAGQQLATRPRPAAAALPAPLRTQGRAAPPPL